MDTIFQMESLDIDDFVMVWNEILKNLYTNKTVTIANLKSDVVTAAEDDIKTLILVKNFNMELVSEAFSCKNGNEERIQKLTSMLKERKTELLYRALVYFKSSYGETLVQSDWVLKVVLGVSDLKTLRYPVLQLILSTLSNNSEGICKKRYDISKDMLEKLIHCLENME